MHPDNPLWKLNFDVEYYRQKQTDRMVNHLEAGNPIWRFTANELEYTIDCLLDDIKTYIDTVESKSKPATKIQPFWKRFKK